MNGTIDSRIEGHGALVPPDYAARMSFFIHLCPPRFFHHLMEHLKCYRDLTLAPCMGINGYTWVSKPVVRNFYWGVLLDKMWTFFTKVRILEKGFSRT